MGLARAQPPLGPGPGDRAGWGRPRAHGESGLEVQADGQPGRTPSLMRPATLPGPASEAKQLGWGWGGRLGVSGVEIRVNKKKVATPPPSLLPPAPTPPPPQHIFFFFF